MNICGNATILSRKVLVYYSNVYIVIVKRNLVIYDYISIDISLLNNLNIYIYIYIYIYKYI